MRTAYQVIPFPSTLRDALVAIGPAGLAASIPPAPGFRVGMAGNPPARRDPHNPNRYVLGQTGLVAEVFLEHAGDYGVICQTITLRNEGSQTSPPINELLAVHLPLSVRLRDCPRACGFGGGTTDGIYPPRAFRPEELSFGQARDWDPDNPDFERWWTTKRQYTLASGPNGRSSNPNLPIMQFGWQDGGREIGLWLSIEWSGHWQFSVGTGAQWTFTLQGGPKVKGMTLEPGESLRLPRMHVGVYEGSPEDGLNRIRRYIADVITPDIEGQRPWPFVCYHHWAGIHTALTDELLRKQADKAAELGAEYFEVDAGWYATDGKRFYEGLGNWERVNAEKFPHGLDDFARYIQSKGMKFALWFEPERARRGSDWATQHPDWYWPSEDPNYFILNLTSRDAQDGLIEMLCRWIEKLDIRWLRWDHNQALGPTWEKIDPTLKVQFAYMEGLYRVMDVLLERHPKLLIDNCAGGGQRIDFGLLRRCAMMVPSDHQEDPHIIRLMQTGGARVLPANYMKASYYVGPGEGTRAVRELDVVSRMAGCMSFAGHISEFTDEQTRMIRRLLAGYRTFRHLLMKDLHPLAPYPRTVADWDVVQFIDPATTETILLAYRMRGDTHSRTLYPVRLAPDKNYRILDPLTGTAIATATGQSLMQSGLRLCLAPDSAHLRHLQPL